MRTPSYEHAQSMRVLWIIMAAVSTTLFVASQTAAGRNSPGQLVLGVMAAALPLITLAVFGRLVVSLDDRQLSWRFGYLGFPRWTIALADITAVEVVRTRCIEGWGIHRTREGWLYNAAGFSAIRIALRDGRSIRLGSDEAQRLAAYLRARIPHSA